MNTLTRSALIVQRQQAVKSHARRSHIDHDLRLAVIEELKFETRSYDHLGPRAISAVVGIAIVIILLVIGVTR